MIVSKIKEILLPFANGEDRSSSVLFDGVWGCGKTYHINEFVKDNPAIPVTYISLFGIDNYDSLVLRLVEKLDAQDIINVGEHYYLREALVPQPYNGMVIVFDDIERKGQLLTFEVFLGLLNNLINLGFKVVGVVDSQNISSNDQNPFATLKEKVFERYITVTASFESHGGLFENAPEICNETHLKLAGQNWRLLIKSEKYYVRIFEEASEKGKLDFLERMRINESQFLSYIVFACKCMFSNDSKPPVFEDGALGGIRKARYERYVEEYGKYTANALFNTFSEDGVVNKRKIVEMLVDGMIRNSYESILDYQLPSTPSSILRRSPFNEHPFYLSDEEKNQYFCEFFKNINDFDFGDDGQKSLLSQVLEVFLNRMTDEQIGILVERIVQTTDYSDFNDFLWEAPIFNQPKTEAFEKFKQIYVEKLAARQTNDLSAQIMRLSEHRDYKGLDKLVSDRSSGKKKDQLICELRKREYILPDLSGNVSDSWSYCHSVCNLISSSADDCLRMKELLKKQCLNSRSNSLRERCQTLCDRYLGGGIDFLKEIPDVSD